MDISKSREVLAYIFGPESSGKTADECARSSRQEYVRSQDHLALATSNATGRRLSAWEAYKAFGIKKLEEVLQYGAAVLVPDVREPAETISRRRQDLGLEVIDLSKFLKLKKSEIQDSERRDRRNSIRNLEKIARALGIDENKLGSSSRSDIGEPLTVRLREIRDTRKGITPKVVLMLNEAAWVIQKQSLLSTWLNKYLDFKALGFEPDSRYGSSNHPAWMLGYELAASTRRALQIPADSTIASMRQLVEGRLGIPLVHLNLPVSIAGATISTGDTRGIAINVNGANSSVWVRRSTIAHELGHLLWDPDQRLKALIVDGYSNIEEAPFQVHDYVEARANAFAIEFLAPQDAARKVFLSFGDSREGLRAVMEQFGVSFTAAKYQIWNAIERKKPLNTFVVDNVVPTDEWNGRESFTNDYFRPDSVPISRRGLFSGLIVRCWHEGLISLDSAASYLNCSGAELEQNAIEIKQLFFDQ